jgi:hypothetical protein
MGTSTAASVDSSMSYKTTMSKSITQVTVVGDVNNPMDGVVQCRGFNLNLIESHTIGQLKDFIFYMKSENEVQFTLKPEILRDIAR